MSCFQPPSHFLFLFSFFCFCLISARGITIQKEQDGRLGKYSNVATTAVNFIALWILLSCKYFFFIIPCLYCNFTKTFLCHFNENCVLFSIKDWQCSQEKRIPTNHYNLVANIWTGKCLSECVYMCKCSNSLIILYSCYSTTPLLMVSLVQHTAGHLKL